MNRRFLLPGAILALALSLLAATPVAHADRLPTREPMREPYDSDPEVPNGAYLVPSGPDRSEVAVGSIPRSPAVLPVQPSRSYRLFLDAQRAVAWFFARVRGGMVR